jgi:tetratricopeptide (TPR) repeat protein
MQRTLILPVAVLLLALPAMGCGKVRARAELKKGNSYYQQEQYAQAMEYFQRGLEFDPDATFAWRSLGLSALALYRPGDDSPKNQQFGETATDAFEKYLADYPDDEKVEEYLMSMYVNNKQYDDALAFVEQKQAERPEEAGKFTQYKINIMMQAGRLKQAYQLAQQLEGEQRAVALYSIGQSVWDKSFRDPGTMSFEERNELIDMGLNALKQSLDLKKDYADAMVYYGLVLREKAKVEPDEFKKQDYITTATEYQQKALALRKKAAEQQPAAANT